MSKSSLHSDENKVLAAFLLKVRKDAGLSQDELAARLGKSQQFVSRLESSERRIDLLEFIMVSRALGHEPRELLGKILRLLPKRFEV